MDDSQNFTMIVLKKSYTDWFTIKASDGRSICHSLISKYYKTEENEIKKEKYKRGKCNSM